MERSNSIEMNRSKSKFVDPFLLLSNNDDQENKKIHSRIRKSTMNSMKIPSNYVIIPMRIDFSCLNSMEFDNSLMIA